MNHKSKFSKKSTGPEDFTNKFNWTFKELTIIFLNVSKKLNRIKWFLTYFLRPALPCYQTLVMVLWVKKTTDQCPVWILVHKFLTVCYKTQQEHTNSFMHHGQVKFITKTQRWLINDIHHINRMGNNYIWLSQSIVKEHLIKFNTFSC